MNIQEANCDALYPLLREADLEGLQLKWAACIPWAHIIR